ncbi:MAG: sugar ABC transporter substrate-binding protein [Oscillibacter sp.]|nr:sugar ABC transporter substrate-binding protein [Oscillibacter sp.]
MIQRAQRVVFGLLILCMGYAAFMLWSTFAMFRMDPGKALERDMPRLLAVIPNGGSADGRSIERELNKAGEQFGAFVEIYETATAEEQRQVLQIAADGGADGVLLYPMEKDGYAAALAACGEENIPVVVISQRLNDAGFDTYIGSAVNSERMAALSCISATEGAGRLLIVDHLNTGGQSYTEAAVLAPAEKSVVEDPEAPEVPAKPPDYSQLRTKISDLVNAPFEGYRVENVTIIEGPRISPYSLYTEIYRLLASEAPDAVFSYDGDVTNVVAACRTNAYMDIYAVGYGDPRECAEQLRGGTLNGLVLQNDTYAAALAVRYLVELDKGVSMPASVDSGIVLVTENNMERILGENEV